MVEILSTEEARLLASIGMLGLSRNRLEDARALFQALTLARPEQEIGPIGHGLTLLAAGDARAAIGALSSAPPTEGTSLFLAIAYQSLGDADEARDILENLVSAENRTIGLLAGQLMTDGQAGRA